MFFFQYFPIFGIYATSLAGFNILVLGVDTFECLNPHNKQLRRIELSESLWFLGISLFSKRLRDLFCDEIWVWDGEFGRNFSRRLGEINFITSWKNVDLFDFCLFYNSWEVFIQSRCTLEFIFYWELLIDSWNYR